MRKGKWTVLLAAAAFLLFANAASAHVTVSPAEAERGAYQLFTVRVPSESKGMHTVAVSVDIPQGVKISRTQPVPGWSYELTKDAEGKITNIAWKAEGAGLSETELQDFHLSGRVEDNAGNLVWVAHQTYDDGSVVNWEGSDPEGEFPASVTTVTAAGAGEQSGSSGRSGSWALGLSIAAAVLAAASLAVSLTRRKAA